jgi:predicted PurR-regulated permease PerM
VTIQGLVTDAEALLEPALARLGVGDFDLHSPLEEALDSISKSIPAALKAGIVGMLNFIFALLLLFFLLRDGHKLKEPVIELMPVPDEKARSILKVVYDTVHATFFSTVVVALIQGTLLGIAFWILGLPAPLLWGVAGAILSMIPFMGTPILWVPACILLASRGQWIEAVVLALFGAFVIGLVDNVLKPVIIGARVKLHTIAVFFAIVGGIVTLGPVGVLVGPVLLSVALGVIEILREMATQQQPDTAPPA